MDWWQSCLGGTEPIGLLHVVTFGFIRIATNPRVFVSPMTAAEAAGHVRAWLGVPTLCAPVGDCDVTLTLTLKFY